VLGGSRPVFNRDGHLLLLLSEDETVTLAGIY